MTNNEKVINFVNRFESGDMVPAKLTKESKDEGQWNFYNEVVLYIIKNISSLPNIKQKMVNKFTTSPLVRHSTMIPAGHIHFFDLLSKIKPFCTFTFEDYDVTFPEKTSRNIRRIVHKNFFGKSMVSAISRASVAENTVVKAANIQDESDSLKSIEYVMTNNHKRIMSLVAHLTDLVDTTEIENQGKQLMPSHYGIAHLGTLSGMEFAQAVDANDNPDDSKKGSDLADQNEFSDKFIGLAFESKLREALAKGRVFTDERNENLKEVLSLAISHGLVDSYKDFQISPEKALDIKTRADEMYSGNSKRPYQDHNFLMQTGGIVGRVLILMGTGTPSSPGRMQKLMDMMYNPYPNEEQMLYRERLVECKVGIHGNVSHRLLNPVMTDYCNGVPFDVHCERYE